MLEVKSLIGVSGRMACAYERALCSAVAGLLTVVIVIMTVLGVSKMKIVHYVENVRFVLPTFYYREMVRRISPEHI